MNTAGSNVSLGYKQTEVGVIPSDWNCYPLSAVAASQRNAIVGGPFGSDLVSKDYVEVGVPVIRGQNMNGRWIQGPYVFVTDLKARSLSANLAHPGDIVFTQRGTLGQVSLVPEQPYDAYLVSQSQMKVTLNRNLIDPIFLFHVFSGSYHQRVISDRTIQTGVPHINLGILRDIPIQVPSLPEQRAIAEALSDVDELLRALEALIVKKRAIKQATMQQLFSGKTRLPGFSGEWETKRFGEFAAIRNHKVLPSQVNYETPCVELEHIGQGDGRLLSYSKARHSTATKYRFFPGDVLFGRLRPYLRKFWLSDRHGICTTEIWPLIVDAEQASSGFLRALVETDGFIETASISYGTHMPRADWGMIKNFETRLPNVREQEAIANVLSDMEAEIAALEARRDKTRAIKHGMMQQLLTGRIRLVKPQPAEADA